MSEKPKRRFWQLHLSTALILLFVTGGLLFINTTTETHYTLYYVWPAKGWPFEYWIGEQTMTAPARRLIEYDPAPIVAPPLRIGYLLMDILFSAIIIGIVGLICEMLISRREARQK